MTITNYLWDEDNILYETDGSSAVTAEYTYSPEQYGNLISEYRTSTTLTHHYDALGSTVALTDDAATVTDVFTYTAWGEELNHIGSTKTPYRWVGSVGYYYDSQTGNYSIRSRNSDPIIARWISRDPLLHLDGSNPYIYTHNNGISLDDPSGALTRTQVPGSFIYGNQTVPEEGFNGAFSRKWKFALTDKYEKLVIIVQKITIAQTVRKCCYDSPDKKCDAPRRDCYKCKSTYYEVIGFVRPQNTAINANGSGIASTVLSMFNYINNKNGKRDLPGAGPQQAVDDNWVRLEGFKFCTDGETTYEGVARAFHADKRLLSEMVKSDGKHGHEVKWEPFTDKPTTTCSKNPETIKLCAITSGGLVGTKGAATVRFWSNNNNVLEEERYTLYAGWGCADCISNPFTAKNLVITGGYTT